MKRQNALGRGLDALIPGAAREPGPQPGAAAGGPAELPVASIDPNPDQPRREFDPEEIERLADSIRQHGVLQPVVVRRRDGGRYELVVGERRWRASRAAGRATIPAVVADVDEDALLEVALVENVQRRDLNPMELAHAFRRLTESGSTQEDVGRRVSLDRSTVANHLRLLDLSREMQADVEAGRLSVGHAKALLQVASPERRRHLRDRILRDGLSVRAAEELGRSRGAARPAGTRSARSPSDPELLRLADSLRQRFQTRVRLQGDAKRGRIEVEFFGPEDLQRIAELMLGDG